MCLRAMKRINEKKDWYWKNNPYHFLRLRYLEYFSVKHATKNVGMSLYSN